MKAITVVGLVLIVVELVALVYQGITCVVSRAAVSSARTLPVEDEW
jgi:hypothetical protein